MVTIEVREGVANSWTASMAGLIANHDEDTDSSL